MNDLLAVKKLNASICRVGMGIDILRYGHGTGLTDVTTYLPCLFLSESTAVLGITENLVKMTNINSQSPS